MRNDFSGFYGIDPDKIGEVFTSKETVFIFDTNILLTLYRCEEETRDQFFAIWRKVKDQCWFPHHVCLEYQRNRLSVVKGSRDTLSSIHTKINNRISELKKEINSETYDRTISRYSNLRGELEGLFNKIDDLVTEFQHNSINVRNNKIDFFSNHDIIRDQIDELTEGHIGPGPENQDNINSINALGKTRYKYNTGPGFEDAKDKKSQFYSYKSINYDGEYGDFYVWHQILTYVESNQIKNVVYVTNDAKSDFFFKIDGKVRGPNESLITEIKSKGANEFILQNINTFLHHANTHLNAEIDDTTIIELTNASPPNKDNIDLLKIMKKQELQKSISNYIKGSLSINSFKLLKDTYNKTLKNRNSTIKELEALNSTQIGDFDQSELDGLERYKEELSSKINKYNAIMKSMEKMLINTNLNKELGQLGQQGFTDSEEDDDDDL